MLGSMKAHPPLWIPSIIYPRTLSKMRYFTLLTSTRLTSGPLNLQWVMNCSREQLITIYSKVTAWETLAYLSGHEYGIERLRRLYREGQHDMHVLGTTLSACGIGDRRMSLALWRIWAYCILLIEAMLSGKCMITQKAWLRGPTVDQAL